jgi:2'-hydroxyisoflavone reductase
MRLLFFGGTLFLGRHLVEAALARGHDVTTFTRGITASGLFPGAEEIHGDRGGDLSALRGRDWDAVVDTCGYVPRVVRSSAQTLAGSAGHYTFVSSINAYADLDRRVSEESRLAVLEDPSSEDVQSHYGPLKVLCEQAVAEAFGDDRTLVVRPGLIVGPHDPTGRFSYWAARIAAGGEVLAPGDPERQVQLIDARDLAAWMLDMVERRASGAFTATSPQLPMREVLEACGDARLTWVDDEFLLERGVSEWDELPLWLVDPSVRGMLDADVSRAVGAGLTFRPLAETARDTLHWLQSSAGRPRPALPGVQLPQSGMDPALERELLAEWHRRSGPDA